MTIFAGAYETNITPPLDVPLAGYAGRWGGAAGVHDELFARALVCDTGRARAAVIALDLIAIDFDLAQVIRRLAAEAAGLEPRDILVHCTHTHAGPVTRTFRGMGGRDAAYTDVLCRKAADAVRQAATMMQPARILYGESTAQIGVNRRQSGAGGSIQIGANFAGPVSPLVQTVCVNTLDGRPIAILFSHACHPVVTGPGNRLISADWPGAAVATIKERLAADAREAGRATSGVAMFLQGACGNVNPIRRGGWEDVAALGRDLGEAALSARWSAHSNLSENISSDIVSVHLPAYAFPEGELARLEASAAAGAVDPDESRSMDELARWVCDRRGDASLEPEIAMDIQRLTLGGIHLLGIPAEVFVEYQLDFAAQTREPVITLSCTNGCTGYLPTAADYPRGGYEVIDAASYYGGAMPGPGSESVVRSAAFGLLGLDVPAAELTPLGEQSAE